MAIILDITLVTDIIYSGPHQTHLR